MEQERLRESAPERAVRAGRLYNPLSRYLKERYGFTVFKVSVDAGFTCPNRDGTLGTGGCIYCEPASLVPLDNGARRADGGIEAQLEAGIEAVSRRHRASGFIAYFQHKTGTYAPLDYLSDVYTRALVYPGVVGLAVSTRPDCVGDGVLDLLVRLRAETGCGVWLELGLQSAVDATLERINRQHTAADFADAAARARERGIDVCAHVMLGLPGEGLDEALCTTRFLVDAGVWGVKFHQLQVLRGTRLEEMCGDGTIRAPSLEEYVVLVVGCLEELPPGVVIHRLCADAPARWLGGRGGWGANKFEVLAAIERFMIERGAFQGRLWRGAGGVNSKPCGMTVKRREER